MIRLISILFMFSLCTVLFAQAPDTMWTKTFGGSVWDAGYSVKQTTDGGYIITGYTRSFGAGESDVWLIKTDANGDTIWTRTFGGSDDDVGYSVDTTSDGGYIVTGYSRSFGANGSNVWLIKTDANGDTIWTRTFGGIDSDEGKSVQQTTDGGYIVTGYTRSLGAGGHNVWLIKTDANGDTLWSGTFQDSVRQFEGTSVQQTTDRGYIIVTADKAMGGSISNFPVGASKSSYGGIWLIKTDANGDTLWTKTIIGINQSWGNSIQQTSDGGYIYTGVNNVYCIRLPCYGDLWLVKTNANGDTMWTKTFGDSFSWDEGYSVQQTSDGGYVITGKATINGRLCWLIKTDANGDTLWTKNYGGASGHSVRQTSDGGYIVTGSTGSPSDLWLIKVAPDITSIQESLNGLVNDYQLLQNYPNPFNPSTTIEFSLPRSGFVTLKVYNILGEEVATLASEKLNAGNHKYEWDAGEVASGIYLYRMSTKGHIQTRKMILMK